MTPSIIKKLIKKAPGVKRLAEFKKMNSQFRYDKNFFRANYSHSREDRKKLGYNMLLISHALEKGMSNKHPRQFGRDKTIELMKMIQRYTSYENYEKDFALVNSVNILRKYADFYEKKMWQNADEYKRVTKFLDGFKNIEQMKIGEHKLSKKGFMDDAMIDYRKFLASRHSVREFLPKQIKQSDFKRAIQIAALSPSACNRQMCKVYYVMDKNKSDKIIPLAQGFGGFEKSTINLLVVTFDVSANYMVGERNQGWFNAGLFSMNLVNALHSMGIGSCFCQFGNSVKDEEIVKKVLDIPKSERVAVLIATGYYCDETTIPYSPRKNVEDICRVR